MQFNLFTLIFLIAIFAYAITLLWLNVRQGKAVSKSFNAVPSEFSANISLPEHQKSANYTQAKLRLSHAEILFSTLILLIWTLGGGLDFLDGLWQTQSNNNLHTGVGFIASLMLIGGLLDLPFSLYRTFVLEQKFGFNKTDGKTFITDLLKGLLLILLIALPLIYAVLYLMAAMGEFWWIYVWLVLTGFSLLMLWLYPSYIAPIFNKFKALEDAKLKAKIDNLLQRTGFKSDGIFVMDGSKRSSHGNAYFTGIG
ncbi:MAG: M48 family metallopeptidase, partial [Candidatus Thioglobus sp.]|nr:M48 family metallopeptidase [Candidatus Thioglobus sp.]